MNDVNMEKKIAVLTKRTFLNSIFFLHIRLNWNILVINGAKLIQFRS